MRIWMLSHYAVPPTSPGITRHYDLARELVRQEHVVTIFASGFNHRTKRDERLAGKQKHRRETIDGVEFVWLKTFPYRKNDWRRVLSMLTYCFRAAWLGLRLNERPDVVLASSPDPFSGLAGCFLARAKRAAFIFEVRDLWPQTLVDLGGYSEMNLGIKTLRILERFLYRQARRIVVLHAGASEYLTRLGVRSDKIVYIPNGVDPEAYGISNGAMPPDLTEHISQLKQDGKSIVCYAGAHGLANALDTLVEAARLLQDEGKGWIHFLLVGDGPEKSRLMEKAEGCGLRNVTFHESISKKAVPQLLGEVDLTTVSWWDSHLYRYGISTNKLWDYMMCAKPVVWACKSTDDPVTEAECGLTVAPENPRAMADAIVELCNRSPAERRDMGAKGQAYVMERHSTPVLAGRLLEVIATASSAGTLRGHSGDDQVLIRSD